MFSINHILNKSTCTVVLFLCTIISVYAQSTWTGAAGNGNWTDPGNWNGGIPIGNATATFDNTAAVGNRTVNIPGTITVGTIIISGNVIYNFNGNGDLNFTTMTLLGGATLNGSLNLELTGNDNLTNQSTIDGTGTLGLDVIMDYGAFGLGSNRNDIINIEGVLLPRQNGNGNDDVIIQGGVVQFSSANNDQLDVNYDLVLDGGNFSTGGGNEVAGGLVLRQDGVMDMNGSGSRWEFSKSSGFDFITEGGNHTLTILNWDGNSSSNCDDRNNGGGGTDKIIFSAPNCSGIPPFEVCTGGLTDELLDAIIFIDGNGDTIGETVQLSSGEVVPCIANLPPTIECPEDVQVECITDISAYEYMTLNEFLFGLAKTNNNGPMVDDPDGDNNDLVFSVKDAGTAPSNICGGTQERVYEVRDSEGATAECTHTITVRDQTDPEIQICPVDRSVNVDVGETFATVNLEQPTVADNCNGTITITHNQGVGNDASGQYPVGSTTIEWTITDECGNDSVCETIITVLDDAVPVIECPPSATVACIDDVDNTTLTIDNFEQLGGTINYPLLPIDPSEWGMTRLNNREPTSSCNDSLSIPYQLKKLSSGLLSNICYHTQYINDTIAPQMVDASLPTENFNCVEALQNNIGSFPDVFANDNGACEGQIQATLGIVDFDAIDPCSDVVQLIYTAQDACLNKDSIIKLINIEDNIAPVYHKDQVNASDTLLEVGNNDPIPRADSSFLAEAGVISNNCDANQTNIFYNNDEVSLGGICVERFLRTYLVTDGCKNSTIVSQYINKSNVNLTLSIQDENGVSERIDRCDGESANLTLITGGDLASIIAENDVSWTTGDIGFNATAVNNGLVVATVDLSNIDSACRVQEETINIRIFPIPDEQIPEPECAGDDNLVTVASTQVGPIYRYRWTAFGNEIVGSSTGSSVTVDLTDNYQSYVELVVMANNLCESEPIRVDLKRPPYFRVETTNPSFCAPLITDIYGESTEGDNLSYAWNILGVPYGPTSEGISQDVEILDIGLHDVNVTAISNTTDCIRTLTFEDLLMVNEPPVANLVSDQTVLVSNNPVVTFTNLSENATHYSWDFADANRTVIDSIGKENVSHLFADGIYKVVLTAHDGLLGCHEDTASVLIKVISLNFNIPNAIRPGTNIEGNGVFLPLLITEAINTDTYVLQVFNRWGNRIFESEDISEPWNAMRKNGKPVASGAYLYRINFEDIQGKPYDLVGTLLVLD